MNKNEILSYVDHTLLAQGATWEEIKQICIDGIKYGCASVCIPPSFVKAAKAYTGDKIKICTVIGFPNGYNTTKVKCFEASDAVKNGADEIDMVINIGFLKDKKYDELLNEINEIKKACDGRLLKVIIETCLLTDEEKIRACLDAVNAHADFVKTSTGFSTGGATVEDVKLMKQTVQDKALVKASGGIKDKDTFLKMIEAGASRIGASKGVEIIKELKK